MKQCLNCYGVNCKDRCRQPEKEANYGNITTSVSHMAEFLSKVITDCSVCPSRGGCPRDKKNCEQYHRLWLHAKVKQDVGGVQ